MDEIIRFFSDGLDFGDSIDCLSFLVGLIPSWIITFLTIGCLIGILIGIVKLIINLL